MREAGIAKYMRKAGWTLVRCRKHGVWRCPCGLHQVTTSMTASDHRAIKNALGDVRRAGCKYQP